MSFAIGTGALADATSMIFNRNGDITTVYASHKPSHKPKKTSSSSSSSSGSASSASSASATKKSSPKSDSGQTPDKFARALNTLSSEAYSDSKKAPDDDSDKKSGNDSQDSNKYATSEAKLEDPNIHMGGIFSFMGSRNRIVWANASGNTYSSTYDQFDEYRSQVQGNLERYSVAAQQGANLYSPAGNFGYLLYSTGLDQTNSAGFSKTNYHARSAFGALMMGSYYASSMVQSLFDMAMRLINYLNVLDWAYKGASSSQMFAPVAQLLHTWFVAGQKVGLVAMSLICCISLGLAVFGWQVTASGGQRGATGAGMVSAVWTILKRAFIILILVPTCAVSFFMVVRQTANLFDTKTNSIPNYAVYSNFVDFHNWTMMSRLNWSPDVDAHSSHQTGDLPTLSHRDILKINYQDAGHPVAQTYLNKQWTDEYSNPTGNYDNANKKAMSLVNQWRSGEAFDAGNYASDMQAFLKPDQSGKDSKNDKDDPANDNDLTHRVFVENAQNGVSGGEFQGTNQVYTNNSSDVNNNILDARSNQGGLSTMGMYGYLLMQFSGNNVKITDSTQLSNDASLPQHYNVNLVGEGFARNGNLAMSLGLMLSTTILSIGYLWLTFMSIIDAIPGLAVSTLGASFGMLRGGSQLTLRMLALIISVFVSAVLYSMTSKLLIAISECVDSILGGLPGFASNATAMLDTITKSYVHTSGFGALGLDGISSGAYGVANFFMGFLLVWLAIEFLKMRGPILSVITSMIEETINKLMNFGGSISGNQSNGTQGALRSNLGGVNAQGMNGSRSLGTNLTDGLKNDPSLDATQDASAKADRAKGLSPSGLMKTGLALGAGAGVLGPAGAAMADAKKVGHDGKSGANGAGSHSHSNDSKASKFGFDNSKSVLSKSLEKLDGDKGNFNSLGDTSTAKANEAQGVKPLADAAGQAQNALDDQGRMQQLSNNANMDQNGQDADQNGVQSPLAMQEAADAGQSSMLDNDLNQAAADKANNNEMNAVPNLVNENQMAQGRRGNMRNGDHKALGKHHAQLNALRPDQGRDVQNMTPQEAQQTMQDAMKSMENVPDKGLGQELSNPSVDKLAGKALEALDTSNNNMDNSTLMDGLPNDSQQDQELNQALQSVDALDNNQVGGTMQQLANTLMGDQEAPQDNLEKTLAAGGMKFNPVSPLNGQPLGDTTITNPLSRLENQPGTARTLGQATGQGVSTTTTTSVNGRPVSVTTTNGQGATTTNVSSQTLTNPLSGTQGQNGLKRNVGQTVADTVDGSTNTIPGVNDLDQSSIGGIDQVAPGVDSIQRQVQQAPDTEQTVTATGNIATSSNLGTSTNSPETVIGKGVKTIAGQAFDAVGAGNAGQMVDPTTNLVGRTSTVGNAGTTTTVTTSTPGTLHQTVVSAENDAVPNLGFTGGTTTTVTTGGVPDTTVTTIASGNSAPVQGLGSTVEAPSDMSQAQTVVRQATQNVVAQQQAQSMNPDSPTLQDATNHAQLQQRASQVQALRTYNSQPAQNYLGNILNPNVHTDVGTVSRAISNTFSTRQAFKNAVQTSGPNSEAARAAAARYRQAINYAQGVGIKSQLVQPNNEGYLQAAFNQVRHNQVNVINGTFNLDT